MTEEFSDPPHGQGAWYTWSGNEDVGMGKMTSTEVTWSMDGQNDFMAKLVGVFLDFDAMIGADFEKGLENLGSVATTDG